MANPQVILQLSRDFFKRNNPIDSMINGIVQNVTNLMTMQSKMKLLKYKFMLAQQQLGKLENSLHQGSPYEVKGQKINKAY